MRPPPPRDVADVLPVLLGRLYVRWRARGLCAADAGGEAVAQAVELLACDPVVAARVFARLDLSGPARPL